MTKEEIIEKLSDEQIIGFYGYMRSFRWVNLSKGWIQEEIIFFEKKHFTISKKGIYNKWSSYLSDSVLFKYEDYGKTWAFSKEEIKTEG